MEEFTVVIPYFNEAGFIRRTLESLLAQTHPPTQLVLVDNASTDGSERLCRQTLRDAKFEVVYLREPRPGWIHAIQTGASHVRTEFLVMADADTYYPPHYLEICARLFREGGSRCVATMAKDIYVAPSSWKGVWTRWFYASLSKLMPWQILAGGPSHVFRTAAYVQAGGYSADLWPYVLADHEVIHRLHKLGRTRYHHDLWNMPSPRRTHNAGSSWTFGEQMIYLLTPPWAGDWFFYRFLTRRFERRNLNQLKLRTRPWEHPSTLPTEIKTGRAA